MSENSSETKTPETFVNTATAPRWLGTFGAVFMTVIGLFGLWISASNPIFGLGIGHPVTLAFGGFIICLGVGLLVFVWVQPDSAWRKVPDGPLSPGVRTLADAGRIQEAMTQLRVETGAGMCEARQVIEKYLANRPDSSA